MQKSRSRRSPFRSSFVRAACLLCLTAFDAVAGETQVVRCDGLRIEIEGVPGDVDTVCVAGRVALERLAELGMVPLRPVRIVLVDDGLLHGGVPAYGRYDGGRDRLELMSPTALGSRRPQPTLLGRPLDEAMYAGLVAHELTHAVAEQNRRADKLGNPAQEYLAYAVQLASLPEPVREEIVASADVQGWERGDTVSTVYLGLDVHKFAVKSYLHLYLHPDRDAALAAVLASRGNRTFTAP